MLTVGGGDKHRCSRGGIHPICHLVFWLGHSGGWWWPLLGWTKREESSALVVGYIQEGERKAMSSV